MIFRNKSKYQMYLVLLKFNKSHNIETTKQYARKKLKINDETFFNTIYECVNHNFIDGIKIGSTMSNHKRISYSDNIYITYSGYEFLKNYYANFKKLLWNLFLIVTTAVITVKINNWLSKPEQLCGDVCNPYSQGNTDWHRNQQS